VQEVDLLDFALLDLVNGIGFSVGLRVGLLVGLLVTGMREIESVGLGVSSSVGIIVGRPMNSVGDNVLFVPALTLTLTVEIAMRMSDVTFMVVWYNPR